MSTVLKIVIISFFLFKCFSCKSQVVSSKVGTANVNDTTFVNLKDFSLDFVYDMKYASSDNFFE
jgi:D-alanyl-D-alanine dipeptidase